jgi:hypothetical protein
VISRRILTAALLLMSTAGMATSQTGQSAPPAPVPAQTPASPAPFDCTGPEYRQFDFWIGDWDVVWNPENRISGAPPPGAKPARNVVTKIHDGCVVFENWDDQRGGTGQSFNIFDRVTQRWHQTWVSNTGSLNQYWGELKNGRMVFVGQVPLGPAMRFQGRRTIRLSFIPMGPDTVRQFSEALNSDGTWSVNYDLIYTRRAVSR